MKTASYYPSGIPSYLEWTPGMHRKSFGQFIACIQRYLDADGQIRIVMEPGDGTRYELIIIVGEDYLGIVKRTGHHNWYVELPYPLQQHVTVNDLWDQLTGAHTSGSSFYTCHVILSLLGWIYDVEQYKKVYDWGKCCTCS